MIPPFARRANAHAGRAPLAAAIAGALLVAVAASAQIHGTGEGPGPGDVPAGDGTIVVRVVHPGDSAHTSGLEVALYALAPDGTPGLRSGTTDDSGSIRFEGVSTASDVVYLVGARYRDIPFGQRVTFAADSREVSVEIEVTDPIADTSGVRVAESEWRLQWVGSELWVQETHTLENKANRVVQVPEAERKGRKPAFSGVLPDGATGFTPALGSFSQGLAREGSALRFWGPVYSGRQEVRYQYRLPLAADPGGEDIEVATGWPAGTPKLEILSPEDGPDISVVGARARDPLEQDGERFRVLELGPVKPGATLSVHVHVPPASHDVERIHITRADVWVDLDDVAASVSQEIRLKVADGPRLAGSHDAPLLRFELPEGAQLLGASQNAASIGLGESPDTDHPAIEVLGPLTPGETAFGIRYRLGLESPDEPLRLPIRWPREVDVMNVLVADTGLVVEDQRLHRLRPVRSGTRTYLLREGFHIEPEEVVDLEISRIARSSPPHWASLGLVLVAGVLGAGFLLQPLRRSETRAGAGEAAAEPAASRERVEVIESLRDLDHDYETGKLSREDYDAMRAELRAQAVELLRREREEAAPAAAVPAPASAPAAERGETAEAQFCPQCGQAAQTGWRFCARCGAALPGPVAVPPVAESGA